MEVDFPYYNGKPVPIGGGGWALLLASVALAFASLSMFEVTAFPATLVPALLFAGIPLAALAWLTGRHWTALFRPVGIRDLGLMGMFAALSIGVSFGAALLLHALGTTASNPVAAGMAEMTGTAFLLRLAPTLPQLVGEELLTMIPFLALLWLATQRFGWGRRPAVLFALIVSSLLFGAAHLPTYDWHWTQCFGVIGAARVVLTLAYLRTKNLWVSAGAHVINDWVEFAFVFGLNHLPIGSE